MTLQTSSQSDIVVLLTDTTRVGQVQGVFKARRKDMSMAALIPGLEVKVEGNYDEAHKLVATSVWFKGNDLEQAQSIRRASTRPRCKINNNRLNWNSKMKR